MLSDFFDSIYCINLDKRPDRWDKVMEEFRKMNIEKKIIRFPAIEHTEGWQGARDSHVAIVQQAKLERKKQVLVLEDDVAFLKKDYGYYSELLLSISRVHWHLLYFSANTHCRLIRHDAYLFSAKKCLGLHSIAYHESVYDIILKDYANGKIKIIDEYLQNIIQPMGRSFVSALLCTTQTNDFSDIENKQVDQSYIQSRFEKHVK